jgi:His-Xaa-Ser repeat protein HxsA
MTPTATPNPIDKIFSRDNSHKGEIMNQGKKFLAAALVVCLFILLAPGAGQAQPREVYRWRVASLAPQHLGYAQQFINIVLPYIKDSTNDSVRTKIFWGGVMGNDEEYLEKMRIGQLQGAGLTGHGSSVACPEFSVVGLPFLFNDYKEVDYIREVMFSTFDYYFSQYGFKLFLWIDQDFDQIYSSKFRFDTLEDFSKSRFQTWYGAQEMAMLKALGAQPVPLPPTQAPAAYRTGGIDSNIGPAIYQVGSQMYTFCKYINPMKTRYAPATVLINMSEWQILPAEYRQQLDSRRDAITASFTEGTRKDNQRSLEGMLHYGLELVTVTPENHARIKAAASKVYDDLSGELYPKELLLEVQRYLAAYRKGEPVTVATAQRAAAQRRAALAAQPAPAAPASPADARAALAEVEKAYQEKPQALDEEDKKIAAPAPAPPPRQVTQQARTTAWESRRELVRQVQTKLQPMGYYPSKIDGIFGPVTYKGIQQYQQAKGLSVTGTIDSALLESLGIAY